METEITFITLDAVKKRFLDLDDEPIEVAAPKAAGRQLDLEPELQAEELADEAPAPKRRRKKEPA